MEKLNKLVEIADDAISSDVYELRVKVGDILAIEEAFRALEQSLAAAEAKLAELEKQKPYGYVAESPCSSGYGGMMHEFSIDRRDAEHDANQAEGFVVELFTRPAPAINLAELVPVEGFLEDSSDGSMLAWQRGWNACRVAILHKIEEAE